MTDDLRNNILMLITATLISALASFLLITYLDGVGNVIDQHKNETDTEECSEIRTNK